MIWPRHEAALEQAFVVGLDEVHRDYVCWHDAHSYMTIDDLREAGRGFPRGRTSGLRDIAIVPPELDDDDFDREYPFLVSA